MTSHLMLTHIGPVQEFIAQARRSRDLWFGSHLLSELARAMVKHLLSKRAEVVFPAITEAEAKPQVSPLGEGGQPVVPLPNHVLAILPAGLDPAALSAELRAAVRARLRQVADAVRKACNGLIEADDALWNEQVDTLTEFHAAWSPFGGEQDYPAVRHELEATLAARRNLRDFAPWQHDRVGAPKSSLDGARVSVLRDASKRGDRAWRQLRLGRGEQLDAIGLIKRTGGDPDQFVPLANVAAGGWIEQAAKLYSTEFNQLTRACQQVGIGRVRNPGLPWVAWPGLNQGYDAEVLYRGRWIGLFEEVGDAGDAGAWGKQNVEPLLRRMRSEPTPYVACLAADGDHVGALLDAIHEPAGHRQFSARLAKFAGACHKVVADHRGMLIYSGGDDVLAFVGVDRATHLAAALSELFAACVGKDVPAGAPAPSLSVGIGVGHLLDGMAHLLQIGRDALQYAKGDHCPPKLRRNALAILVDKRSGGTHRWRGRWDASTPAQMLERVAALLQSRQLPRGKVYEVDAMLRRFPRQVSPSEQSQWMKALAGESSRILARAHGDVGITPADAGLDLGAPDYAGLLASIEAWVQRCRVAFAVSPSKPDEVSA